MTSTGVACENKHSFDRARQGYLNLLPVQYKASRAPGDNTAMVQARRSFLSAGYYRPIADFLCEHAVACKPSEWLDIGCGEGYYSHAITTALGSGSGYALDISKEAIIQACKRDKNINWLIASMARVPLATKSLDLLFSIFSPLDWQEAERLLSARGVLLHLGPARDHLLELRKMIYDSVRPYNDAKHLAKLPDGLQVVHTEFLNFTLNLPDRDARLNLLLMTPHGQRARQECRDNVVQTLEAVTVSVRLDRIERVGD